MARAFTGQIDENDYGRRIMSASVPLLLAKQFDRMLKAKRFSRGEVFREAVRQWIEDNGELPEG